ncbi:MAG: energy transducer TonB [Pseudomonadota bacterium]
MSKPRKEKKSEMIEVRIPHSKKQAFMKACEEEGITASHAIRTFIDAYLKRSRRMKVKQVAQELSMTLIRNPIKTTGTVGTTIAATLAVFMFSAGPSAADRDAQPIAPPTPYWPESVVVTEAMLEEGFSEFCDAKFNVDPNGYVETPIEIKCSDRAFENSVRAATVTLRFEPKMKNGIQVRRSGVIYPYQFTIEKPGALYEQQITE